MTETITATSRDTFIISKKAEIYESKFTLQDFISANGRCINELVEAHQYQNSPYDGAQIVQAIQDKEPELAALQREFSERVRSIIGDDPVILYKPGNANDPLIVGVSGSFYVTLQYVKAPRIEIKKEELVDYNEQGKEIPDVAGEIIAQNGVDWSKVT